MNKEDFICSNEKHRDISDIAIQKDAEVYSFNIGSQLYNQLNEEQQKLWRKEIEEAYVHGCHCGIEDVKYITCEFLKTYRQESYDGTGYVEGIINDKTIDDFKNMFNQNV